MNRPQTNSSLSMAWESIMQMKKDKVIENNASYELFYT